MKKWLTTVLTMMICATLATAALAEADLGFKGIGGGIGIADPEDLGAAFNLSVMANFGTFAPHVAFDAVFDFWSKSENFLTYEYSVKDFAFAGRVTYRFDITSNPKIKPFAGGGLGIHFVKTSAPSFSIPGIGVAGGGSDTKVKIGLDLGGGSNFTVGERLDIVAELWFRIVSDVNQIMLKGGIIYWLGE
ncbi:MAG: outer membrane beta-barrel protein [Candidatus Krumholzibacteria bacterium]|nr:outer membrane beta-barrel protein [Candidatus Krumholzibacteria bacterium]